ncbi:MAG TPA: hypothetical protein VMV99_01120 [Rhodanobacter sp.]|nr:hypothetical protein [Rhodanobacter sp.]
MSALFKKAQLIRPYPENDEGPLWAGLRRVSLVETFSYATARRRLALLFARLLLLPASVTHRAEGALVVWELAIIGCMAQ